MPLPDYLGRGILFFSDFTGGWSESYLLDGITYDDWKTSLISIAAARLDLLHEGVAIIHAYVSNVAVRGDAFLVPACEGPGTISSAEGYMDLDTCLIVTWQVGVFSRNRTFLRGFPIIEQIDGFYTPSTAFATAFTAYKNLVVGLCLFKQFITNPTPPPAMAFAYNPATTGSINPRLGRRKTGRPFGLPRGRLLAP